MVTGQADFTMRVKGASELRRVARALKDAGRKDLRRNLLRRIREAGKPAVQDVRSAVRSTPAHGPRHTGLRARIAAATGLTISTSQTNPGIRIRVRGGATSPSTLPKYLDGEASSRFSRWRHPVFGNREAFVQQPSHPYFFRTLRDHEGAFRSAVERALDDTAREIG